MSSVSRALSAPALAVAIVSAAPGLAQSEAPIGHILVQYRPASGDYCADMAPKDAILRPAETRCGAEPGWTQQRLVMARR